MTQTNAEAALTVDDLHPLIDQLTTQLGLAQLALSLLKVKMQATTGAETMGATGMMEMLLTVTKKKTGPPSPASTIMMTTGMQTMIPTVLPISTCSGDWPTVQESIGWPTKAGPEDWTNIAWGSSASVPPPDPTPFPTSSNTVSTYQ
jgi:hypothetical protein